MFERFWARRLNRLAVFLAILTAVFDGRAGHTQVLTRNYNNQRTGATLSETILNTSTVNSGQFGKLFMLPVDDQIYAGVLYVPGVQIAGGTHNVVYVATVNNTVYAFDADTLGPPLWSRNFNGSGQPGNNSEVGQAGCGTNNYHDFRGNIGIVGTPVIDGVAGTIYFVTRTVENGATVQRLRALDITTGNDRTNSPQVIQAAVSGSGDGGSTVVFNPLTQNQRPALGLSQGAVYIAWASYCDSGPYHGWVMAYDSNSLAQVGVYNVTPNGTQGGIWMAGAGPVFDSSGYIFYSVGNGTFDGASDLGEALIKLAPASSTSGSLTLVDYFAPSNFTSLNSGDLDFGSSGPTLLPGTNTLVSGGKEGRMYVLNATNLGHESSGDTQIPQVWQAVDLTVRPSGTHHIHNASPTWNSPEGLNLYVWGENDFLHAFQYDPSSQTLTTPPFATGEILPPTGMPGGMMTISANGSQSGSGVLWASVPRNGDANRFTVPGNLYAFNAETLAPLWSSTGVGDDMLNFSKGSPPIVANGKVYVGSTSGFVSVYGLKAAGVASQDLALNQTATGSTPCTSSETPDKAFNGSASGGLSDKWCSNVNNPFLRVDLGAVYDVSRFVLEHAGAGGESFNQNTAAFNIQVSTDGANFSTVVNVTNNIASITTHDITPTRARYVQLNVIGSSASIYEFQVFSALGSSLPTPDFSLSVTPGSASAVAGMAASYTASVTAIAGFSGSVALSASGLPAGATATFLPPSVTGSGNSALILSTAASTPPGAYTISISGVSGSLSHSATVSLTVTAPSTGSNPTVVQVNLSSSYNVLGMVMDGSAFSGGLDGIGHVYSANLLGSSVGFAGLQFTLGPPNVVDAVTSATVALPGGQFSTMAVLATGVMGHQVSQSLTVNYTDGTSSSYTQSFSDWYVPKGYAGEAVAVAMPYRDMFNGTEDGRPFYLYAYTFALNGAKTVQSVTLPANADVSIFAITLTTAQISAGSVNLSAAFNTLGIVTDGSYFTGGLDEIGHAYSANLLTPVVVFNGLPFTLGPPNVLNAVTSATVALPAGQYSTMTLLGTGVLGNQPSQTLTVTYTDGTSSSYTQSFSDWYTPQNYPGETVVATMAYRDAGNGTEDQRTFLLYGYSFSLNPAKTVQSVTLPANLEVAVLGIYVQ